MMKISGRLTITAFCALILGGTAMAQPQYGESPDLPKPYASESTTRMASISQWPEGKKPTAPQGFKVTKFADDLKNPRSLYILPNGDVLTAEAGTKRGMIGASADRVSLLRDADKDGIAEEHHVLIEDLNQPFGITLIGETLYVANTDSIVTFPYRNGDTKIAGAGKKIADLPAGGYNNHWTRNLLASKDGKKIYVSVGSASNNGEHGMDVEKMRASILEMNPDGTEMRVFASGLRNPVPMAWNPDNGALWTAVNERDHLGDDLVPDYMTSVRKGGFYGWPYSYWGKNLDPRMEAQGQELVARAITPDYALGAHTASLGLAFYEGDAFPATYRSGAFVAQRGSWNRSEFAGYKVVFVPFANGRPAGAAQDFLTGFLPDPSKSLAHGRPVSVAVTGDGALLVSDDSGDSIWHVSAR